MNARERVLITFGKLPGKADRVPVQFEMCRQLTDHFGKELDIPAHYTENLYEDVTYRISANELRTQWAAMWWSPVPQYRMITGSNRMRRGTGSMNTG